MSKLYYENAREGKVHFPGQPVSDIISVFPERLFSK
jgi:hypothetical protein